MIATSHDNKESVMVSTITDCLTDRELKQIILDIFRIERGVMIELKLIQYAAPDSAKMCQML